MILQNDEKAIARYKRIMKDACKGSSAHTVGQMDNITLTITRHKITGNLEQDYTVSVEFNPDKVIIEAVSSRWQEFSRYIIRTDPYAMRTSIFIHVFMAIDNLLNEMEQTL